MRGCIACTHLLDDGRCELHRYLIWLDCEDFEPLEVEE